MVEPARDDIAQEQPDGPEPVKGQEPKTLDKAAALFSELEMRDLGLRWSKGTNWFR
jgi:hypothetical protein